MALMPNPFEFAASDAAAEQAAGSIPCPLAPDGAADHSDSGATDCATDEAAASPGLQALDAAADLSCIGEIFVGARKLNLPRFKLDEERFFADIEEPPLFLRQAV
jgi:hypothetical protein